jgi:transcriptional regulator with XRE-family HTH domain
MKSTKGFKSILAIIGERLAELRIKKGYSTIKEFAQKYDLPQIQYWRMEKGKANITLKSLVKVLDIHKISLQDFFCLITEEELVQ